MELTPLTAISPIDGRYRSKCASLDSFFSEFALIRYRVRVEIEYFIALCELPLPNLSAVRGAFFEKLRDIYRNFSLDDAAEIKKIEATTNHDVKAVEYFIKERFDRLGLAQYKEFIHFGLTSQDINNTAVPLSIADSLREVYFPLLESLITTLNFLAREWRFVAMLAKTHGQPASPTRLGKEIRVFAYRLEKQLELLKAVPVSGKFGGATGNFNAHHLAFPEIDWPSFANSFLANSLGIVREEYTTQISNYDNLAALFDALRRINTIVIDLDRDFWQYISMNYFKQKIKEGEVGSSAMPHKVNPIDYENSEGNLGMANAILGHLASKLPVSRLQRDLTDSTVLRNVGVPIAHAVIAFHSTLKGLGKLLLNKEAIDRDLNDHWAVLAEAIQTVLRREGFERPYELLKGLTRTNNEITAETLARFIDSLDLDENVKAQLKALTPDTYTGY
ncbi:MAG: adenylosuccinate lyase [Muribaculaceae bacterium]|nr:adenylosuccinate lyase [Muribaculaceae bacterium]